jgi:hypothetical protein
MYMKLHRKEYILLLYAIRIMFSWLKTIQHAITVNMISKTFHLKSISNKTGSTNALPL